MKTKALWFFIALTGAAPSISFADSQCGPFRLAASPVTGYWTTVNGEKVRDEKVTFLKSKGDLDNVRMKWTVAATKFSGDYAMEYVNKAGKPDLNVEIIRTSRSQIRISGSYDCKIVN